MITKDDRQQGQPRGGQEGQPAKTQKILGWIKVEMAPRKPNEKSKPRPKK